MDNEENDTGNCNQTSNNSNSSESVSSAPCLMSSIPIKKRRTYDNNEVPVIQLPTNNNQNGLGLQTTQQVLTAGTSQSLLMPTGQTVLLQQNATQPQVLQPGAVQGGQIVLLQSPMSSPNNVLQNQNQPLVVSTPTINQGQALSPVQVGQSVVLQSNSTAPVGPVQPGQQIFIQPNAQPVALQSNISPISPIQPSQQIILQQNQSPINSIQSVQPIMYQPNNSAVAPSIVIQPNTSPIHLLQQTSPIQQGQSVILQPNMSPGGTSPLGQQILIQPSAGTYVEVGSPQLLRLANPLNELQSNGAGSTDQSQVEQIKTLQLVAKPEGIVTSTNENATQDQTISSCSTSSAKEILPLDIIKEKEAVKPVYNSFAEKMMVSIFSGSFYKNNYDQKLSHI